MKRIIHLISFDRYFKTLKTGTRNLAIDSGNWRFFHRWVLCYFLKFYSYAWLDLVILSQYSRTGYDGAHTIVVFIYRFDICFTNSECTIYDYEIYFTTYLSSYLVFKLETKQLDLFTTCFHELMNLRNFYLIPLKANFKSDFKL